MTSSQEYEYAAITAPRAIRVMRLHPGLETDPIQISLEVTALDSAPNFESISYCWGTNQDRREVTCDGATLYITNSLFTGLAYFRHADKPRTLWADAICINQADAIEKGGQVLLMPHIYSKATRTLVWLGVAEDPVYGAVSRSVTDSIRQASQLLPAFDPESASDIAAKTQALHPDSLRLREEGKPNILDHDWSLLSALLARPWFRRKWVIQEIALSREVVLHAGGGVEVPWPELAHLAFNIELLGIMRLGNLEFGKSGLEVSLSPLHCVGCVYTVQLYRQYSTLLDGVLASLMFNCTDPRDHVYSLLNMGTIGPSIVPDYTASDGEVFRRFAIAMLVEGQNLKLLSLATEDSSHLDAEVKRLEGLPSWVPDLRLERTERMVSYTIRPQAFFAGGRGKPMLSISDDQNILVCKGRVIDTVKTVTASLVEMLLADRPELKGLTWQNLEDPDPERRTRRFSNWLHRCYRAAFGSENAVDPSEERMAAFARTMVCDLDLMRNRMPAELIATFPQYIAWARERAEAKHGDVGHHPFSFDKWSATIDECLLVWPWRFKFVVTDDDRFGNVPLNTRPGDRVCVLLGGEVPFILRPTERGTYTLVGECYVDGIMDGELFSDGDLDVDSYDMITFE
ncbi:heterokaryon incompatibility protein-domain-containing protein [Astrocystis sublimbata]|nr:heterokaryon incompatibility protein-domain-containing protein [Astrocystis sublimbata]